MRQIVLDTETTGLDHSQGHRIIEIGCIEMVNRRITGERFHQYVHPDRDIDPGAVAIHGITSEFLSDKPRFHDIAEDFIRFVSGAEVIIHNAPFDVGFLNHELRLAKASVQQLEAMCVVVDTLVLARQMHPGGRNSLDALCRRYQVDRSERSLHGAALDAGLLAEVYLAMTGGQVSLRLEEEADLEQSERSSRKIRRSKVPLRVIEPDAAEQAAHSRLLDLLDKSSGQSCVWRSRMTASES